MSDITTAVPAASVAPATFTPPSVHVRAIATWLTIFPLVAIGMTLMADITVGWMPVFRALVLTAIVVPLAVYLIVPRMLGFYVRTRAGRAVTRA
jgi:antibiotic biosynthesis monooxygenase (ABM) superfamily enzyme